VNLQLVRVRASSESAGGLVGTVWRLEDLGGDGVLDRVEATLEFPEEGRAAGNGSCNRFFGPVRIERESISFGALGSTRMACAEPVGNQEAKYLEALQGAERFALDGSTLSIYSKGMEKPLRFTRKNP
jgi:heat shock protein HslJ